jgi:hypothetical protein
MLVRMNEIECMDFLIVQKFLGTLARHPATADNKADLVDQLLAQRELWNTDEGLSILRALAEEAADN